MGGNVGESTSEEALDALGHVQRRALLRRLLIHNPQADDGVAVTDTESAAAERTRLERMRDRHLPKLENDGFITWNRETNEVSKGPNFEDLRPILELLAEHDDDLPDEWLPDSPSEPTDPAANPPTADVVGTVAHDLRNPLSVAQGNLDLARENHDSEALQQAAAALDRMAAYVEDISSVAHIGPDGLELSRVDLAALAAECWHHVETETATLSCTVDQAVRADRNHLSRLLENLFRNAVVHGDADLITVGPLDDGFFVADDGTGIPAASRDRVFETGYSTRTEGTGFGLSIIQEIADAHDWTITLRDGHQGGTRFDITGVDIAEA